MPEPARFDRNLAIARVRFDADASLVVRRVEDGVAHMFKGALAILNPLAKSVFHHVGIREARKRLDVQFDIHVRAARAVAEVGALAAYERHIPEVLAHDDFLSRIHTEHAAAGEAHSLVSEGFRTRLPPLARLLHDGDGATFDELVRSALTRDEVEETLAQEFGVARRLMDLAEERPGLVKAPRALLPKVVGIGRDLLAWYEGYAQKELDRIYAVRTA